MNYNIIPITEKYITGFCSAVDLIARERKYLAFLEEPPLRMSLDFVHENLRDGWPHFIALVDDLVVGWAISLLFIALCLLILGH